MARLAAGMVQIADRGVQAELPLPVAGLLWDAPLAEVVEASQACVGAAEAVGCKIPSPFQILSFLALSVIPKLKSTDRGLVDVDQFEVVALGAE
jgi:adenine deaminase